MQKLPLTDRLKTLTHRLSNKKGHRFLYGDFDRLVDDLKQVSSLSQETLSAIQLCVSSLIWEANVFRCYPLWAIRCNLCAARLAEFLPDKEVQLVEIENQQDAFAEEFIDAFVLFPTFNEYCERLSTRPERTRRIAALCFEHSDSGRRPHLGKDEELFYALFKCGYNLAEQYISTTGDFEAFTEWFKVLDPFHIEQVLENIENVGWNDDYIHRMLEDTLIKQLKLLKRWLEGDTLSFVNYWRSNGIIKLLELVDDDTFFMTLRALAEVNSNIEVRAIIEYYINDDEINIQTFAKQLLNNYT